MVRTKNLPTKTQEELLIDVNKKLDVMTRLIALMLPKNINQDQKIKILSEMGLPPKEISIILGTTSNTVSVELNRMKKQSKSNGE